MKPYDIHDIVIKLVGVYIGLQFLNTVEMMLGPFRMSTDDQFSIQAIALYAITATMFILAWICVFNTDFIHKFIWSKEKYEDTEARQGTGTTSLSFWLTLMGFYFGLLASIRLVNSIGIYIVNYTEGQGFYSVPYLASQALQLLIALTFIFAAKHIERFINAVQKETRQEKDQLID